MSGATGLTTLTLHLTKARFTSRQGETLLYFASILAFAICGTLSLTVAAGTWMFNTRRTSPTGKLAEILAQDPQFDLVLTFYFALALIACAMLIPTTVALARSAAILGARGRERRLATLRLIGLSSSEVTRMSLVDTVLQALIGLGLGVVGYLATFSLWQNLSFQGTPLTPSEMLLPWWLGAAVVVGVLLIGVASSWWGLRQVRISPLGISRRANKPAVKWWVLIIFFVLAISASLLLNGTTLSSGLVTWVIVGGAMLLMALAVNILGPYLLQSLARVTAALPSPTIMWASRRIVADPRATWARVSSIGLLAFVGGFLALMPISMEGNGDPLIDEFASASQWDLTKGAIVTLAIGLVLSAISILISQASAVFERAEQTVAMQRMGAPLSYQTRVMWTEVLAPLLLSMVLGFAGGVAMASPMLTLAKKLGVETQLAAAYVVAGVLAAGLVLGVAALMACGPLQRQVLAAQRRAND
ncbi:FtsX-like permease family protein [Tessaracoccus sp. OH4464_COT-324]|uniref:FtsX-like permease family protein n=1 Tax=Tessaracoccus sp. OH4464_COT-324 TaxID=2491059 RepID=UPI00131A0F89|nr:FtsX-like permease family protein [Tessaracoccus sp. OH4464_COT-324]